MRRSAILARVAVLASGAAACALAWRSGGGADPASDPPRAAELDAGGAGARGEADAGAGGAEQVVVRLVESVRDARIDDGFRKSGANAAAAQAVVGAHWRKMRPPYVPSLGDRSRFVTSIALRTSASETQWSMPTAAGKSWAPDARVWNMNEGSFDQREALVAPAPSTFTFRVTVPPAGRLTFAEGTVNATWDATVFAISVVDGKGISHPVYRHHLPPAGARRWTDATCDLSAFAGQTVDLALSTDTEAAGDGDKRPPKIARRPADAGADAGAAREDALVVPGPPVALWGNPTLLGRTAPRVPYNVLWIVVDALRPDVLASFHDDDEDAKKLAAPDPPLEALLPKIPGLTPVLDGLAARGVRFTHAYSAGAWTRPGTLAMLSGARSSELGIDTQAWVVPQAEALRFYGSDPPLLPLLLRRQGVATRALVNNYFMVGYAPVGLDMGFERISDHRYRTRDTRSITEDATSWIRANKGTRFFLFVNYDSPHEPYEPPAEMLARVPAPPAGPKDPTSRMYMAEAAKDDEAIGVLLRVLEESGLAERTIIVVTADHGETLSSAHAGISGLDKMPVRYHHAASNYEETTRVPILVVAEGLLPAGREVKARVRNVDLAPTLVELLGLEPHPRMTGSSLVGLARGQAEAEPRVVVSEGRGTRGLIAGHHRLLVREGAARTTYHGDHAEHAVTVAQELFDLDADPGERKDLGPSHPELVAEMRARLQAALANVPVAGANANATATVTQGKPPVLHLRFAGGPRPRRISGSIVVGDARAKVTSLDVQAVEIGRDAFNIDGGRIELALATSPTAAVGLDLVVDPPGAPVTWELYLDDAPLGAVFGGPYGLLAPALQRGVATDDARLAAQASALPPIDPRRDVGLFVARERRSEAPEASEVTDEGAEEMARLLREWGYAHGSGSSK